MVGIRTRKVTIKDTPRIIDIQESIMKAKVSREWMQGMETQLKKQHAIGFVALKNSKVVGYITGEIKGPGFGIEKSGWIEFVGVYPGHMGSGIGKALAQQLFDYFKKKGIRDIYTAARWDAADILSFLKSIGFNRSDFVNLSKHLE